MGFELRYVGSRFEGTRLPVEVLSDLPAFRDLLVAFAKDAWREGNSRQRVPKGFDKSIAFDLVGIRDGSAIPQIAWNRDIAQANLPGFSDQLEEIVADAYNMVVRLIDDAGARQFPISLSADHIRALNKLGAGLRENERIEFKGSKGRDGGVVYLDAFRRKDLITHVKETYETRIGGVGRLIANDDAEGFIKVETAEYGEIKIPVDREKIKQVFDGSLRELVQFDIQIELDNKDHYRGVVEVFDTALIDAQIGADLVKCRDRLEELRGLQPGWHNGQGAAIDASASDSARKFLARRPAMCGSYRIYPTDAGGIVFEFESNGWDLSVEFVPGGSVEFFGVEVSGHGELKPMTFSEVSEDFVTEFDKRTGAR